MNDVPTGRSVLDRLFPQEPAKELGDFTTNRRVIPVSVLAVIIGILSGAVAKLLLLAIGLFTNLFFFQRWSTDFVSPSGHHLGWLVLFVPVSGALVIGLIARYGSERVRGHGIPEALEAILTRGSRVEPRLAVLKPLSAAISIGSGGPFGAEGPIIMTGGAFGSLVAQAFHLTNAERKTLLVAGAAGGMSATFGAPIAAVLLAVELLLFELKPRSFVPVALASVAAMAMREWLIEGGPIFHMPPHPAFIGATGLLACVPVGLAAGMLAAMMTWSVYACEDLFLRHVRVHWMWWPAIGGAAIGIGGLVFPRALGVGYDSIGDLLTGRLPIDQAAILILVKWAIWSISLGSGTSGGVLAPLLMLGGALGTLESTFLPQEGPGFWSLVSMGAVLGGTMRSPLTGIIFAVEITHDYDAILPLTVAVTVAHLFTVLVLRRSILTEKVARRGFHVSREYGIDPLEVLFVHEVMIRPGEKAEGEVPKPKIVPAGVVVAHPDETLRAVAYRMAQTARTRLSVVEPESRRVVGKIALRDMLAARRRHMEEETRRERPLPALLGLPMWLGGTGRGP